MNETNRFEIEVKSVHVRFYEKHPDNYKAVFTGWVMGRSLHISGLVSKSADFYREFGALLPDVLRQVRCTKAALLCTPKHARLIQRSMAPWADVEVMVPPEGRERRELVETVLIPKRKVETKRRAAQ